MDKKVAITGIIVLGVIILAVIAASIMNSASPYNTISANGDSTIKVLPDFVGVYFNVQTTGTTASDASDKNTAIVAKLKSNIIALGFKEEDIQTQSFNVGPDYDWSGGSQRIKGYSATHAIVVKVPSSEQEKIGKIIDAGINAGAGINYINYELSPENQNKYKAEALKAATEDATLKAEAIAEGAGQRLGKLVSISTSDFAYVPWIAYSTDSAGGSGVPSKSGAEIARTITPSEQEVSAHVTAVFKIR